MAAPTLCGLLAVCAILLLAPMTQAASAGTPQVTLKAPFTGVTASPSLGFSSSGCAGGQIVRAPFFNSATGKVGFSIQAHARSCSAIYGDSASASASESLLVPVPAVAGNNYVHAKWTVDASVASWIGSASCTNTNLSYSYCDATAYAELTGYAYLYDATNGSYYFSHTSWAGAIAGSTFDQTCIHRVCTATLNGNQHFAVASTVGWTFHVPAMDPSHSYMLEVSWYANVFADDFEYQAVLSGAHEGGLVTMSGPGLGAVLNAVTVG